MNELLIGRFSLIRIQSLIKIQTCLETSVRYVCLINHILFRMIKRDKINVTSIDSIEMAQQQFKEMDNQNALLFFYE